MIIPQFETYPEFLAWFAERAEARHMKSDPVMLHLIERDGWIPDAPHDHQWGDKLVSFRRKDERFWALIGKWISQAPGREVWSWGQPIIVFMSGLGAYVWRRFKDSAQPSVEDLVREKKIDPNANGMFDGRVALFIDEPTGDLLVRVLAEPGNWGYGADAGDNTHVLLAPTLQFSEANFENHARALRGEKDANGNPYRRIPLAEFLDAFKDKTAWITTHGSGGLELFRRVRMTWVPLQTGQRAQVEVAVHHLGEQGKDFCWLSRNALRVVRDEGYANDHLLKSMGLLA